MNKNQVVIKVLGQESEVKKALKKIESIFPLFVESKVTPNDGDDGVHVFLKIALPLET